MEGASIIDGFMNQIIFYEFLVTIINKINSSDITKKKRIIFFMDNLYAHKTLLIQTLLIKYNVEIMYNAPYSPELNIAEYAFNHIKQRMKDDKPIKQL